MAARAIAEITSLAIQVAKLGLSAYEAAHAGNVEEATRILERAQDHASRAKTAWDEAAQPGDDEGD